MKKKAIIKDFIMEIKTSFSRFLSIFFIVALGTAFFAGIRATDPDMRITADSYYDKSKLMDIRVVSNLGLTKDDVTAISKVTGVEEVEPNYSTHVICKVKNNELVVEVMSATKKLNKITVTKGRMPESSHEVLVDPFFIQSSGMKIGDTIKLTLENGKTASNILKVTNFKIVGIGTTAYYLSFQRGNTNIGSGDVNSFLVVDPEAFRMGAYSSIYVSVKGARKLTSYTDAYDKKVEKVAERLKKTAEIQSKRRYDELFQATVPSCYVLNRSSIEAYVEFEQNADRMGAIGIVFPAIFFLVAALVSLTTMTRMVEEERTQIGVLKALGYSKKVIAAKYLLYALLATLGGSLAGAAVGLKILPMVIITAYKMLYPNLPMVLTPFNTYYAAFATICAVLTVEFATLIACYKELLAKPADLMRPVAPKIGKKVILEHFPFIWSRLSFTWKATIRNLLRYKKRFFMTIFGIGGCMALLLVGFGLRDSIFVIYTRQFDEIMLYEVSLKTDPASTGQDKALLDQELQNNNKISERIKVFEKVTTIRHNGEEKNVNLVVPEQTVNFNDFIVLRSRTKHIPYELKSDGIILTEQIAKKIGVKAGDELELKLNNKTAKVKVAAITENYLSHYVYMSKELYEKLYKKAPDYNEYYIKMPQTNDTIEKELGDELLGQKAVTGIFYISYFRNLLDHILVSLNIVVAVLIIAAGALAFVVLYNLNNININERRRELATIKVLGFYNQELAAYVYRENIILTIIGCIFGIGFGIVLHHYVIITTEIELVMFGRNINFISYIYSILLTFLFSAIVNFLMYFKLKKINMVESLKSVE